MERAPSLSYVTDFSDQELPGGAYRAKADSKGYCVKCLKQSNCWSTCCSTIYDFKILYDSRNSTNNNTHFDMIATDANNSPSPSLSPVAKSPKTPTSPTQTDEFKHQHAFIINQNKIDDPLKKDLNELYKELYPFEEKMGWGFLAGSIAFLGFAMFSLYSAYAILDSDRAKLLSEDLILKEHNAKKRGLITIWNLVAGMCSGPFFVATEAGRQFIKRFILEAGSVITLQGFGVNLYGWRSPIGQLIQALTSAFFMGLIFSAHVTFMINKKINKKSDSPLSETEFLSGDQRPLIHTFKDINKWVLLSSVASLVIGLSVLFGAESSFFSDAFSYFLIHYTAIVHSKMLTHLVADSFFLENKKWVSPLVSFISSIFVSEAMSSVAGPGGTVGLIAWLGIVLAGDQTIKLNQVANRINLMSELKIECQKNPDFINSLKTMRENFKEAKPENPSRCVSKLSCGHTPSELGFTSFNLRIMGFLLAVTLSSLIVAGAGLAPAIIDFSTFVQFLTAWLSLTISFYGTNYLRNKQSSATVLNQIKEKSFINPFVYLATISISPLVLLWGYFVNQVWAKAYNSIGVTSSVPASYSYGITPLDFILFFALVGRFAADWSVLPEWERVSEPNANKLISYFRGNNQQTLSISKEEIDYLISVSDASKSSSPQEHSIDVKNDKPSPPPPQPVAGVEKPKVLLVERCEKKYFNWVTERRKYCKIVEKRGNSERKLYAEITATRQLELGSRFRLWSTAFVPDIVRGIRSLTFSA